MFRRPRQFVTVVGDEVVIDGPDLTDILEEVRSLCGEDAEIIGADRCIEGGIAGLFGREWFVVTARAATAAPDGAAAVATADAVATPIAADPVPDRLDGASFAAALAEALDAEPRHEDAVTPDAADPAVEDPVPAAPAAATVDAAAAAEAADPVRAAAEPEATAPRREVPTDAPSTRSDPLQAGPGAFVHLTLPELDLDELLDRLDGLVDEPVLPPAKGVVAVLGEAEDALAVAGRLARAHGGDPEEVVLASNDPVADRPAWLSLGTPTEAAVRQRRWAKRDHPTFVAVILAPGAANAEWAGGLVQALRPAQVRLVVPAWRSPDEIGPRLASLPPVDAVDLVHLRSSAEPAAWLGVAPPVATLDGRPAVTGLWATYLVTSPRPLPGEVVEVAHDRRATDRTEVDR